MTTQAPTPIAWPSDGGLMITGEMIVGRFMHVLQVFGREKAIQLFDDYERLLHPFPGWETTKRKLEDILIDFTYNKKPYPYALTSEEKAEYKTALAIKEDTPLSALFRENYHDELRKVLETWQPYLTGDTDDLLILHSFQFDLSRMQPATVYLDLVHLIDLGGLLCSMLVLSKYMFMHSNLSKSENSFYTQLKRYKKMSK